MKKTVNDKLEITKNMPCTTKEYYGLLVKNGRTRIDVKRMMYLLPR